MYPLIGSKKICWWEYFFSFQCFVTAHNWPFPNKRAISSKDIPRAFLICSFFSESHSNFTASYSVPLRHPVKPQRIFLFIPLGVSTSLREILPLLRFKIFRPLPGHCRFPAISRCPVKIAWIWLSIPHWKYSPSSARLFWAGFPIAPANWENSHPW